jgi:hypothetical protein
MPEFAAAYEAARQEVVDQAICLLQVNARGAAHTLVRNLTCGRPAAEVRAAIAILEPVLTDRLLTLETEPDSKADNTIHLKIIRGGTDAIVQTQNETAPEDG